MMIMTMRSSMMVKPREAVEALGVFDDDLKDLVLYMALLWHKHCWIE